MTGILCHYFPIFASPLCHFFGKIRTFVRVYPVFLGLNLTYICLFMGGGVPLCHPERSRTDLSVRSTPASKSYVLSPFFKLENAYIRSVLPMRNSATPHSFCIMHFSSYNPLIFTKKYVIITMYEKNRKGNFIHAFL